MPVDAGPSRPEGRPRVATGGSATGEKRVKIAEKRGVRTRMGCLTFERIDVGPSNLAGEQPGGRRLVRESFSPISRTAAERQSADFGRRFYVRTLKNPKSGRLAGLYPSPSVFSLVCNVVAFRPLRRLRRQTRSLRPADRPTDRPLHRLPVSEAPFLIASFSKTHRRRRIETRRHSPICCNRLPPRLARNDEPSQP